MTYEVRKIDVNRDLNYLKKLIKAPNHSPEVKQSFNNNKISTKSRNIARTIYVFIIKKK